MTTCAGGRDSDAAAYRRPAPEWGAVCLLGVLCAVLATGCATTRMETVKARTERTTPVPRMLSASIVSMLPQTQEGVPGFEVTCTGVVAEVSQETDVYEMRQETVKRAFGPVKWNHVYTPYTLTSRYVEHEKAFSWARSVGVFTQTRKCTWERVFAPSVYIGAFPVGSAYCAWFGDWSVWFARSKTTSSVCPYTASGIWFGDALATAFYPLALLAAPTGETAETALAPIRIVVGVVGDPGALMTDAVLMLGGVGGDIVNLTLVDTTLPFTYDVLTMPLAAGGDSVCLIGVAGGDSIVSALSLAPNLVCGIGDVVYPSAFATNNLVVGETNGPARAIRAFAAPDYVSMSVTLTVGDQFYRKHLNADGTVWIGCKDAANPTNAGVGEMLLWDDQYRVWGAARRVRLRTNKAPQ